MTISQGARPVAGILLTVAAMVTLAATDAISKHLTAVYPIVQILWLRYLLYAVYGVHLAGSPSGGGFRSRCLALQIARAAILVVSNMVIVYSFSQLPLADVHAVIAVAPLLVTAGSVLVLSETVHRQRWAAVGAGFAGILIILRPGLGVLDPIAFTPLAGACLYALYQILTRLAGRHDDHSTTQFFTAAGGLVCFSAAVPFLWVTPDPAGWTWLALAALGGTLAHVLIIRGLHLAPASTVAPFNYTMLVAATVFGYLVFDDLPDRWTVTGASLVVGSGLYALHRERLANRSVDRRALDRTAGGRSEAGRTKAG